MVMCGPSEMRKW